MKNKNVVVIGNEDPALAEFLTSLLSQGEVYVQQGDDVFQVKAVRSSINTSGRRFLSQGGPTTSGGCLSPADDS